MTALWWLGFISFGGLVIVAIQAWIEADEDRGRAVDRWLDRIYR